MQPPAYVSPFSDDAQIADDDLLYRRISRLWIDWSPVKDSGQPRIRRAAFQDFKEAEAQARGLPGACMSVGVASVLQQNGREPMDLLEGWGEGYGLASLLVRDVRARKQGVTMSPTPDEPWHGIVFSMEGPKRTGSMEKGLAEVARWVHIPDQEE
ncbi:MAG: hypothetical protein ACREA0_18105 [bacterium]